MSEQADPFFGRWAERQQPPLTRHPHAAVRIEHAVLQDDIAAIDADLEVLCARRRAALDRLTAVRSELWPRDAHRHRRRRSRVDEVPIPPAPPGAEALGGADLRATCVGILRRHGPCALRELHGLLHRHGYCIDGPRAVQGLADAMAYEVRQGRAVRLARGVYGAVTAGPQPSGAEPLPWDDPDTDRPQLDPVVLDDPERWTAGTWPDPPERPGTQIRPPDRYDPSTLDDDVRRARARAAALPDRPVAPVEDAPSHASDGAALTGPHPAHPHDRHWDRFVDESVPIIRTWAQRRRSWEERAAERARRREQGDADMHLWGGDDDSGDL